MFFIPHKHSFLTALVAVTLLAGSAGCCAMEEKKTSFFTTIKKQFAGWLKPDTIKIQKDTPAKLKADVEKQIKKWEKAQRFNGNGKLTENPHETKIDQATLLIKDEIEPLEAQERNWFKKLILYTQGIEYLQSDLTQDGCVARTKNFGINLTKSALCFIGAKLLRQFVLPDIQPGIATSIAHGTVTLAYIIGSAAAIRMVQAPFAQPRKKIEIKILEVLRAKWKLLNPTTDKEVDL